MKHLILVLFLATGFWVAKAQSVLTIDEALQLALKNNFDITIAKSQALVSETNNTLGAAGMLPNIAVTGSGNYAMRNNSQGQQGQDPVKSGTNVLTLNAGAELSWTVFDGGKMFVTKTKLNEIEALGQIKFKQQVMQTLSDVVSAYYNVVKQKQQMAAISQLINYNEERVKIAETGFNAGSKKKSDLLQAKIDLNVNRQNAINQEAAILTAKRELARLLASSEEALFDVSSEVAFNYSPNKQEIMKKADAQNPGILSYQKSLEINQLALKEGYRTLFPKINVSTGYYFQNINSTQQSTSLQTYNRTLWPQVGASVSVPIFQGGNLQRQVALAKINVDLGQYDLDNLRQKVNTELLNAFTSFENQQKLLEIENENHTLVKENLDISLQRFRLGEATSLEVRTAQNDFEQSATRLTNFRYNLKLAETKLKQLIGEL